MTPQEIDLIVRAENDLEKAKRYLSLAETEHDTNGDFRARAQLLLRNASGSIARLQAATHH